MSDSRIICTRDAMDRQLRAACDTSTVARVAFDNPLTLAAAVLRMFGGSAADAIEALHRLPDFDARVTVVAYLKDFADEETADTQRPMALGGSRR